MCNVVLIAIVAILEQGRTRDVAVCYKAAGKRMQYCREVRLNGAVYSFTHRTHIHTESEHIGNREYFYFDDFSPDETRLE